MPLQYNFFERMVGKFLQSTPHLRNFIKNIYQRINYLIYKKKYKYKMYSDYKLRIPPTKDASFFGYYDRTCWHKDGNLVLLNKIRNGKMIICIWDLTKDSIIEVSETLTWNWHFRLFIFIFTSFQCNPFHQIFLCLRLII